MIYPTSDVLAIKRSFILKARKLGCRNTLNLNFFPVHYFRAVAPVLRYRLHLMSIFAFAANQ